MAVTIETVEPPDQGRMDIELRLTADIRVTAKKACRLVSVFVGNEIADLLHGEAPTLILSEDGVYWRVPVVLSSRTWGRIGQVGTMDVNVETGDLCTSDKIVTEIEHNAKRFAVSATL